MSKFNQFSNSSERSGLPTVNVNGCEYTFAGIFQRLPSNFWVMTLSWRTKYNPSNTKPPNTATTKIKLRINIPCWFESCWNLGEFWRFLAAEITVEFIQKCVTIRGIKKCFIMTQNTPKYNVNIVLFCHVYTGFLNFNTRFWSTITVIFG